MKAGEVVSLLFHTFSIPKHRYVFDSNTNRIFSVNEEQFEAFTEIEHGTRTPDNEEILREFQEKGFCMDVDIKSIRHPDTDIIAAHLGKKIMQLTLQVTQRCNLRCSYCTFSGHYHNREHLPKSMNFETAKKAIDMALSRSEDVPVFYLAFYGGEPLLELPLIKKCVEYTKQQAPSRGFVYTITTNGTLLTPEVYDYLISNNFNITISLDGPKAVHDLSRKFPNGRGSYDTIMRNINAIRDNYFESKLMFNSVISNKIDDSCLPALFKPDETISYYNHILNFVSDLYADEKPDYSEGFSICYDHEICKLLLSMLGKLEKKYVSPLVEGQERRYRYKYNSLQRFKQLPSVCHPGGPCLAGAMRLFIDVDGRFFPCERVSEKSQLMLIGDLDNGFDVEKIKVLINPGQTTEEQCKKCWAIAHCTMCAAYSDNFTELSGDMRLSHCRSVQDSHEETLKILCFLRQEGYDFEE